MQTCDILSLTCCVSTGKPHNWCDVLIYIKFQHDSHGYRVLPSIGIWKDNGNTNLGGSLAYGGRLKLNVDSLHYKRADVSKKRHYFRSGD